MGSTKWKTPIEVTDVAIAFGGCEGLMPEYGDIPEEFKRGDNPFSKAVHQWFYEGFEKFNVEHHDDNNPVDIKTALRQIQAILKSFSLMHEHKMAGTAFLLSQFFKEFEIIE